MPSPAQGARRRPWPPHSASSWRWTARTPTPTGGSLATTIPCHSNPRSSAAGTVDSPTSSGPSLPLSHTRSPLPARLLFKGGRQRVVVVVVVPPVEPGFGAEATPSHGDRTAETPWDEPRKEEGEMGDGVGSGTPPKWKPSGYLESGP